MIYTQYGKEDANLLTKAYTVEELAELKDQLMDYALLKHELSNGEDKKARQIIKAIQTYDKMMKEAWEEKEKHGNFRW